ncbi:MAG: trimethylamine methyltransferase family protein [Treponema sp.]|nr:trimethylamine methyltransferase family protein [Treponema sp.]
MINAPAESLIANIHEKTLDLLARYGVAFEDAEALEFLEKRGARIGEGSRGGRRVKFPPKLVEEALGTAPESFYLSSRSGARDFGVGGDYPQAYGPGAGMTMILEAGGRRQASFEDAENFLKLAHTSRCCSVSAAGLLYPAGLPAEEALRLQLFNALKLSDKPLFGLTQDAAYAADSIAMAGIACGVDPASAGPPRYTCMGIVNSLSPLAWDGKMLASMRVFARERQPLIAASCAMSGATAHVSLAGTLVSTNAEVLAGIIYMQLLSPGTPVIYGNTSGITDMATMSLSIGAPECTLLAAASAALARHYRLPCRTGGALCDSGTVGIQAGAESMLNLLNTVMSGADFVLQALGVMESFLSISYEKWLFDEEIIDKAIRFRVGIEPPAAGLVDEIIGAMSEEGGFLGHESTTSRFRDEFLFPVLSSRGDADKKDFYAAALELRNRRLADYAAPSLPAGVEAALRNFIPGKESRDSMRAQ